MLLDKKQELEPSVHILKLFQSLDEQNNGYIYKKEFSNILKSKGFSEDNFLIKKIIDHFKPLTNDEKINFEKFQELMQSNIVLLEKILHGNLIVPDFENFSKKIEEIYETTKKNRSGHVADYIPQLKRVDPDKYGVSVCTIDGQTLSLGDSDIPFVVQSTCKPINYCLALEENGVDKVHTFVGREPSGRGFNELTLNNDSLPHNPMINAGAIMSCSLIKPDLLIADRFDYVMNVWRELSGGFAPGFSNGVYLSEKQTADRNFALGYFMREKKAFPEHTNLIETLEFYFQCCSIEVTTRNMATIAASLANSGICPLSGKRIFKSSTVKNCLSLMYACGMYDFSGEFAFTVGIPAKSGVSGALLIVIPKVMGIAIWSPRLDVMGNSVQGVAFCKELVKHYNFHNYDNLILDCTKIDPRKKKNEQKIAGVMAICWAASQGDINEIKRLVACGVDLNDADYDGRTALHLASSEGQADVVNYLIAHQANRNVVDRWGGTPLNDAKRGGHQEVVEILQS